MRPGLEETVSLPLLTSAVCVIIRGLDKKPELWLDQAELASGETFTRFRIQCSSFHSWDGFISWLCSLTELGLDGDLHPARSEGQNSCSITENRTQMLKRMQIRNWVPL